jgi:phosphate transport system permease protein
MAVGGARTAGPVPVTSEAVRRAISGKRVDAREFVFQGAMLLTLLLALGILVTLVVDVVSTGWVVFRDRGVGFLTSPNSPIAATAGVRQGLVGSLTLMLFVVVLAFPIGIAAAVYIEEYARDSRLTRFINANIRNLAGVPSVVYGILGFVIFAQVLRAVTGPGNGFYGRSVISGGLTLGVLVLPIVIITTAEALRAVPASIREAGYGVGATKWEVIRSHVLPYAAPGILTGTVLSLARAFGETAPLLLVGALTGFFAVGTGGFVERLHGSYTTLPTLIFAWSRLPSQDFRALTAAAIMVLLVTVFVVNSVAIVLRNRYERKW